MRFVRRPPRQVYPRPGFTLVELLVVIGLIAVLISAIAVAGTTLLNTAKARNTEMILRYAREAVDQFAAEQTRKPTISKVVQGDGNYHRRYGRFPPDELEIFTNYGLPGSPVIPGSTLAPSGRTVVPSVDASGPTYGPMQFFTTGPTARPAYEHRDLAAMILAIELFSEEASLLLDKIPDRFRADGPKDVAGNPAQFLENVPVTIGWDSEDLPIRYIVDGWGVPLSYLAQRDHVDGSAGNVESSNLTGWNRASTQMIQLNGGRPIILSYGPDGRDQLTPDAMGMTGAASLAGDFFNDERLNHPLNEDNLYGDPPLAAKLAKGIITTP